MTLIKKYNGKEEIIAEKSLIDHNQLANRNQFGAHSMDAIRGLPERITKLKQKDNNLQEQIDEISSGTTERINEVERKAKQINIKENDDSTFTFTNYGEEESKTIQSGFQPDKDTLDLTDDKKMTLKKVYTSDGLSGAGTKEDNIKVNVDNTTIKIENNTLKAKELSLNDNSTISGDTIKSKLDEHSENINKNTTSIHNINSNVEKINKTDETQNQEIANLKARTQGTGGYLNSYNFDETTPSQDDLTNYALQQIGITEKSEIFNGTKIINESNNHLWILTNTPDSEPPVFEWEDLGEVQNISVATNKLLGLVKGSTENLKGSIDLNGEISINNLSTLQDQVVNHSTQIASIEDQARKVTSRVDSLEGELPNKQDKLTAGDNITIKDNTISSTIPKASSTVLGGAYLYYLDGVWNIDTIGADTTVRIPEGT